MDFYGSLAATLALCAVHITVMHWRFLDGPRGHLWLSVAAGTALAGLGYGVAGFSGSFVMLGKTFKGLTDALLEWQTAELLEREVGVVLARPPQGVLALEQGQGRAVARLGEGGAALVAQPVGVAAGHPAGEPVRRGFERETAVVILKCTLAATLAWFVGTLLGATSQVGFAPFTALLVVRPSVYGSVLQSGRYVAAVFVGALLAGLVGLTTGAQLWTFALLLLVALAAGQARFFGTQGTQVPVVAAFALAGGTAENPEDLGYLLLMVCVGAVCALVTNTVFAPAIRFRDAENAVLDLADGLRSLTGEMAEGLREGREGLDLDHWRRASEGFDGSVRNAHEAVRRQEDRTRLNPRRLVPGEKPDPGALDTYRDWIAALSRASRHVQSIVRTLRSTTRRGSRYSGPDDAFLREFAPLLERASEILQAVYDAEEPEHPVVSDELRAKVDAALSLVDDERDRMRERWDDGNWPVYSALITDVERIFEEVDQGYEHRTDPDGG